MPREPAPTSTRAARPAARRAAAPARPPAARRGPAEPISPGRLIGWGLVASVALLVVFAILGAFGVLAFGALAGLWALGVAWIIIFGPPAFDRRVLRTYGRAARAGQAARAPGGFGAASVSRADRRPADHPKRSAASGGRPARPGAPD
ncbi:hypothetical protein [Frankia tisae]|uniref:hypothetical protein n=1 Tax=Frankia tisae TaxID=2950104 RepID=UPI0021C0CC74|nr:hypothetical protein [Frankia tisae]